RAHNPKVVGSNPAPATNTINTLTGVFLFLAFVKARSKQEKKWRPSAPFCYPLLASVAPSAK
ncbi:hypothetical protein, partial [Kosakonia cowanii]|uniref:hypothetical protein n=1 Tax=Kosakonia cowanii TaxID=208223 RepID=UPI00289785D3